MKQLNFMLHYIRLYNNTITFRISASIDHVSEYWSPGGWFSHTQRGGRVGGAGTDPGVVEAGAWSARPGSLVAGSLCPGEATSGMVQQYFQNVVHGIFFHRQLLNGIAPISSFISQEFSALVMVVQQLVILTSKPKDCWFESTNRIPLPLL